jgi:hypothetical protein
VAVVFATTVARYPAVVGRAYYARSAFGDDVVRRPTVVTFVVVAASAFPRGRTSTVLLLQTSRRRGRGRGRLADAPHADVGGGEAAALSLVEETD